MGGPLLFSKSKLKERFEEKRRAQEYARYKNEQDKINRAIKAGTYKFRHSPRYGVIAEGILRELYLKKKFSVRQIAERLDYSTQKISYWLEKYHITTRTISEAIYVLRHPAGDPFEFRHPKNLKETELFGLGLGLYWGDGNKANKDSIRLGNTDPKLLARFIEFLITFFGISKSDMRFGLQIFSDISEKVALDFWVKALKINRKQFYKVTVTRSRSLGTCRHKSQYGVLTVHYHNKKARDILNGLLPL